MTSCDCSGVKTKCDCSGAKTKKESVAKKEQSVNATDDSVEALYFHNKKRCITCNAIESLALESLQSNFADMIKDGKISFKVIAISDKENKEIVDKYEVTWSSLIVKRGDNIVNLTDMGFKYAKGQPEVFKTKFKESVTNILK